ncbi:neuronal cell adhesion molecule-like isoform X2 [Ostrea edulis]|uniref:neuronal cell adhesion molecule-like isoform X2 n=1 Tax=Ostrea edulis TaxID=37623 RepID=UPI0024AF1DE3|nr:neuronal cell adhesion molecule-like isoform X2 [Ostrea edulis]
MKMFKNITVIFLASLTTVISDRPPDIYMQPYANVYFNPGEDVELPCRANGVPRPTYKWKKNGRYLNLSGKFRKLSGEGTIVNNALEEEDEGIYQCMAENEFGTSLSINVNLRAGKLGAFDVSEPVTYRPNLGDSLTLDCVPPVSVPKPIIVWVLRTPEGRFEPINYNGRISLDLEDRLHFANILKDDEQEGKAYVCLVQNPILRQTSFGKLNYIIPVGRVPALRPVQYLWSSASDSFGLRGETFSLKCIFGGNPTPEVSWQKNNTSLPVQYLLRSYGQELFIPSLTDEDAGQYKCIGLNNQGAVLYRNFNVRVQSKPYWEVEPTNIEARVGTSATFICKAKGDPKPKIVWFINGVKLTESKVPILQSGRVVQPNSNNLTFVNLNESDRMVVQCNASNKHGYVFADVYLDNLVISNRPPAIYKQPDFDVYFKRGEYVALPCRANGEPKPTYRWTKNGINFNISDFGNKFLQLSGEGTIVNNAPEEEDEGIYQCMAENEFGTSISNNVRLRMGKLGAFDDSEPVTYRPFLGDSLTLNCIPPVSVPKPFIEWVLRTPEGGFEPINYNGRISLDLEGRLRFTNVQREDEQQGKAYVCVVVNDFLRRNLFDKSNYIIPVRKFPDLNPVQYLWTSASHEVGLSGEPFILKCIFSGNPTPDVTWLKNNTSLPEQHFLRSYGQELFIPNLKNEDAGQYTCSGSNSQGNAYRNIDVRVQSKPYWEVEPTNIKARVGTSATFICKAKGDPKPKIAWFINGVKLTESKAAITQSGRLIRPSAGNLTFINLNENDSLVVQCNASNTYGYVFADVYLNIPGRCIKMQNV